MSLASCTPIINVIQFRADFNEFTDTSKYPDSAVNYWLVVATLLLNVDRWGTLLQLGVELFVAHNLVLEGADRDTAITGGWPGLARGVISAENAGQVTISYDTAPSAEPDGGYYNLTTYGTRFIRFARMMGAGGIQVGPGGCLPGTVPGLYNSSVLGWSGPPVNPGYLAS